MQLSDDANLENYGLVKSRSVHLSTWISNTAGHVMLISYGSPVSFDIYILLNLLPCC